LKAKLEDVRWLGARHWFKKHGGRPQNMLWRHAQQNRSNFGGFIGRCTDEIQLGAAPVIPSPTYVGPGRFYPS
jgi:hypothetical protein